MVILDKFLAICCTIVGVPDSSCTFPALHLELAIFPRSPNFPLMEMAFQNNSLCLGMPLIGYCFWAFSMGRAVLYPGFLLSLYHSTVISPSFHTEYNGSQGIRNDRIIIFCKYVFALHTNDYLFYISYGIIVVFNYCCVSSILVFIQSKFGVFLLNLLEILMLAHWFTIQ